MKSKIYLAVITLAMFACGGETKSTEETTDADTVAMEIDSVVAEIDTVMTTTIDSLEAEIDSVTAEAP